MEFEEALNRQEVFWKEKANLKWHLEGDRNTKYFHKIAKIKTSSKTITSLQDGDLVLIEPEHISNHVVSFYKNLFCTNLVLQEPLLAEEAIPKLITDDINALLTLLPSIQEIKAVVYALNKDSAPGPDGFGAFFFHTIGILPRLIFLMLCCNFLLLVGSYQVLTLILLPFCLRFRMQHLLTNLDL
jgi:hypothetical protein